MFFSWQQSEGFFKIYDNIMGLCMKERTIRNESIRKLKARKGILLL